MATATSIPELGTGVSAIAIVGEPDLAVGDALGSCIFNLAALAVLDLYWREGPLLQRATATPAVVGMLGVAVTAVAAVGMFVHSATDWFSTWTVSPFTIVLGAALVAAMYLIYRVDRSEEGPRAAADRYGATTQLHDPLGADGFPADRTRLRQVRCAAASNELGWLEHVSSF